MTNEKEATEKREIELIRRLGAGEYLSRADTAEARRLRRQRQEDGK